MKKIIALLAVAVVSATSLVSAQSFSTVYEWMFSNGLTTMAEENFRPNDFVTRGEISKFFTRFAEVIEMEKTRTSTECQFSDLAGYDFTLVPTIIEACEYGLVKGFEGNYFPNNNLTEAEALTVVIRALMGSQDETVDPWWANYHAMGEWLGILDGESVWDLDTSITRQKVGTWLYRAAFVDVDAKQDEGTEELKAILEEIFGDDFWEE